MTSRTKIAVDNQISENTIYDLNSNEIEVVQTAGDLPDEEWVEYALRKGAEFIVSPDLDIPNLLDRWNAPCVWIDVKQGMRGRFQADAIKKEIKRIKSVR